MDWLEGPMTWRARYFTGAFLHFYYVLDHKAPGVNTAPKGMKAAQAQAS